MSIEATYPWVYVEDSTTTQDDNVNTLAKMAPVKSAKFVIL